MYYRKNEHTFPSDLREGHGHFVGFSEHAGHAMTFKILTDDTQRVITRSEVRSAVRTGSGHTNLCIDPLNGEGIRPIDNPIVKS